MMNASIPAMVSKMMPPPTAIPTIAFCCNPPPEDQSSSGDALLLSAMPAELGVCMAVVYNVE